MSSKHVNSFVQGFWENISLPPAVANIPAYLAPGDRAVYYQAARDWFAFEGKVVDAGVLVGGSTVCLLYGILNNQGFLGNIDQSENLIHVYDNFIVGEDVYVEFFAGHYNHHLSHSDSFFRYFERNTRPFAHLISLHKGDIRGQQWRSDEFIELLCLDICKGEHLGRHGAPEYFPHLKKNRSIVIHQDYIHAWQPNVHFIMELFADKLEKICEVGDCAVFWCVDEMSHEEASERLSAATDPQVVLRLMDRAIEKSFSTRTRWFMEVSKGMLLKQYVGTSEALSYLDSLCARWEGFMRANPYTGNTLKNIRSFICNVSYFD